MSQNRFSHKKVVIFGAGVAGLTAAHEAAKMGFQVVVYESDDVPGGFAKSSRTKSNMPTEYSWRGFGPWYHNVFEMMKQIPCRTGDGSVYDKELSHPINFAVVPDQPSQKGLGFLDCFGRLDYARFLLTFLRGCIADKRGHEHYARINASEYLKPRLSAETHKSVISTFGPWIGTDSARTSLHHLCTFHRKNKWPGRPAPHIHLGDKISERWRHAGGDGWLILKGPSNEVWFNPWVSHLKTMGVQFMFGMELKRLHETKQIITSAVVLNKIDNLEITVEANHYIMAITPFASQKVIAESSISIQEDLECKKFTDLIADGPHIQIAFHIGFDEKILFPQEWQAIILRDSEYCLTIFPDDSIFPKDIYLGENVQSLWTATATCSYIPDQLTGLTASECSKEDFISAVFRQIFRSKNLDAMITNTNDGRSLKTFSIVQTAVWDSWSFPITSGKLNHVTSPQSKWSNTTNTQPHHPSTCTSFPNLILAGSHVKISADLWSMEGAAESGRMAALALIPDYADSHGNFYRPDIIEHNAPVFFHICSKIDNILYIIGLPNLIDIIIYSIAASLILLFVWMLPQV